MTMGMVQLAMHKQRQEKEAALSAELLRSLIEYDQQTGVFLWRDSASNFAPSGSLAGHIRQDGYRAISVKGRLYLAHRLAWIYVNGSWPCDQIDHINRERDDNRISNLREADRSRNMQNRVTKGGCGTGLKAVQKHRNRWTARIVVAGKRRRLGWFDTAEEAHQAYVKAAADHFGEFARP